MFVSPAPTSRRVPPPLDPGTELGRFVVRHRIGQGSAGAVYRAYDHVDRLEVALKLQRLNAMPGLGDLRHEWELYRSVEDHRHLVQVFGTHRFRHEGLDLLGLSLELADGGSLQGWLDEHRHDHPGRLRVSPAMLGEMARGVLALEHSGLIHGDLRPANILCMHGVWKIADLGMAQRRLNDANHRVQNGSAQRMGSPQGPPATDAGAPGYVARDLRSDSLGGPRHEPLCLPCLGMDATSASYLSPERVADPAPWCARPESDVYSLGVIAFALLSAEGEPPFTGEPDDVYRMQVHQTPRPLHEAPEPLAAFVSGCLQKDPSRRPRTVAQVLDLLRINGGPTPCALTEHPRFLLPGQTGQVRRSSGVSVIPTNHRLPTPIGFPSNHDRPSANPYANTPGYRHRRTWAHTGPWSTS